MNTQEKLAGLLVPVLGLDSAADARPELSLVDDLGAESIDFVEIVYMIKKEFGVELKPNALISGMGGMSADEIFEDGRLTAAGAAFINGKLPASPAKFREGMAKVELFTALSVGDLARIIDFKLQEKGNANVQK